PGILHLRIGRFLPAASPEDPLTATATAVREAIRAAGTLRAAVLDLRGCAGGSLQAAVEVASCWLPPGAPIIEQIGRDPARARSLVAIGPRQSDAPVVVLVDAGTASSAEVVALALRHGRRAPLIGSPTHGKWSVQQLFMLPGGDAMNLTVARLHTGDGQEMSGPLQPDIGLQQDASETWLRLRDELAGETRPSPDRQLERACELAATLALAAGR
ncbi:MAG: S41 family peptidase, partial [Planctomycetes bacterium]|nr:S41 family peptidase [Planctomycetota bacterium]